jgi:hypothetical protein
MHVCKTKKMMIFSKFVSESEIIKAVRKKQYNLWPTAIYFLNDELEVKIGHKVKVEDKTKTIDDNLHNYCSMEVPFYPSEKESKRVY